MSTYRQAGVDLMAAESLVRRIAGPVTATWDGRVVGGFGGFAAGVELPDGYRRPVLMMTTDGIGTKLELARWAGRWEGVGHDLVAMCVDDLAATGALPLGLVDYLAVGALHPERDAAIVESVARACLAAGCPLLGGETAEHPGVMAPDQVDLAGAALGVVERGEELGPHRVLTGDVVIGLPSPNLRSNGFSLVRRAIAGLDLTEELLELLLSPSVIYAGGVLRAVATGAIHAAAHITGGGLPGNLIRVLPEAHRARLFRGSWPVPEVFELVADWGSIPEAEMLDTFNLGIGFCLLVSPDDAGPICKVLADLGALPIGEVVSGEPGVELV
jgi:phosphoribosylformylglycinamidine cyclo-ligase